MLTLTQRSPANQNAEIKYTLSLTAEDRTRSRLHFHSDQGEPIHLQLPRGTVLRDGDLLSSDRAIEPPLVRVIAKPEPVITVTAQTDLELLRAAYHLGNRHVPLEITPKYLRLSPDTVLQDMLEHLGLQTEAEIAPFQPEMGAYGNHSHAHSHSHDNPPDHSHSHSHSDSHSHAH
jgi:urease accessory protein